MALDIDTSRAVVGLREQQQLIRAVLGATAADENRWLEWKSALDISSAHGAFTVARAILGFANRMPDTGGQWAPRVRSRRRRTGHLLRNPRNRHREGVRVAGQVHG